MAVLARVLLQAVPAWCWVGICVPIGAVTAVLGASCIILASPRALPAPGQSRTPSFLLSELVTDLSSTEGLLPVLHILGQCHGEQPSPLHTWAPASRAPGSAGTKRFCKAERGLLWVYTRLGIPPQVLETLSSLCEKSPQRAWVVQKLHPAP